MEDEQSIFQDCGGFLGRMRERKEMIVASIHKKIFFGSHEMPPGVYEVSDKVNTSENLKEANVSIDFVTMKSRLLKNSFFNTMLELSQAWDYKPNTEYINRKKNNIILQNRKFLKLWLCRRIKIKWY